MQLPRLDPDEHGNAYLQELVRRVHPDDAPAFIEKLTSQPLRARFHTYRELLVGAHLRDRGFDFRYEYNIGGQTPDWSLLDDHKRPLELIDVLTPHQRHEKDHEIDASIRANGQWTGWISVPPDHIYRKLNDKAGQYAKLAREAKAAYVLAVYGEFTASISPSEMEHVLFAQHGGLFKSIPRVSGVIYCRERNFNFEFTYFSNPYALHQSAVVQQQISGQGAA